METTFLDKHQMFQFMVEKGIQVKESYDSKEGTYDTILMGQLENCIKEIKGDNFIRNTNRVSTRIAAIVVIEEILIRNNNSREMLKYSVVISQTKVRFRRNISNRDISSFPTIEHLHPSNPCLFYDTTTSDKKLNHSNRSKKGSYKSSLKKILDGKNWIYSLEETEKRISDTYTEVKLC
jgi:hypothetical protein